jgi:hypothetical protein
MLSLIGIAYLSAKIDKNCQIKVPEACRLFYP